MNPNPSNQAQNPSPESTPNSIQTIAPAVIPGQKISTDKVMFSWMIPLMVLMVVGATIFMSIRQDKIEYVYSLASACFGYYFGFISPRPIKPTAEELPLMNGVEQLTK